MNMTTPKYQIGQKVWTVREGRAVEETILGIYLHGEEMMCSTVKNQRGYGPYQHHWESESIFWPSREELIKSL